MNYEEMSDAELHMEVAEKVLGLSVCRKDFGQCEGCDADLIRVNAGQLDWELAGQVIEKMRNVQMPGHVGPTMLHCLRSCANGHWSVQWCSDFGCTKPVIADTAPRAICIAALRAVEGEG